MTRMILAATAAVMSLGLAACGTAAGEVGAPGSGGDTPVAGMCAQDQPDCVDTVEPGEDEPVAVDEAGVEQLRDDARFYLGVAQDELPDVVRIGRIGDEHFALTEDYRVGRITVELDDTDGGSTFVVTRAVVELPDGPETFERDE